MKKRGKCQASMEYLMVVGLVFAIIVPMVYLFYSYSTDVSEEVTEAKVSRIGSDIVNAAEEVFYLGEPSKTTLRFDMPGNVFDIVVQNSRELVFRVGDRYKYREIVAYSNVDLDSYLIPYDFVQGKHAVRLEARGSRVVMYSGDFDEARRLSEAYRFAKDIIWHSDVTLHSMFINEQGYVTEGNQEDVAYVTGSSGLLGSDFSAAVDISSITGELFIWVGPSGMGQAQDETDGTYHPTLGVTITGSYAKMYYHDGSQMNYFDGSDWVAGARILSGTFEGEIVSVGFSYDPMGGYTITLSWGSDPGESVLAPVPADISGEVSNFLIGETSDTANYFTGQILEPTSYSIFTAGTYQEFDVMLPNDGADVIIDSFDLERNAVRLGVIMPNGEEPPEIRKVSFDSYVPFPPAGLEGLDITPSDPSSGDFKHTYLFENKGTYVIIGEP